MSNTTVTLPASGDLSKAWTDLGATNEFMPPDLQECRIFFTGDSKTGKTSLMAGMEGAIILDLEGGAHSIPRSAAHRVWVPVYHDQDITPELRAMARRRNRVVVSLTAAMKLLRDEAMSGKPTFRHVVIDSADKLQELVIAQLSKEKTQDIREYKGGKGGWSLVAERALSFPRQLYQMGYGWTVIGHLKREVRGVGESAIETERPAITPGFYGGICMDAEYLIGIERLKQFNPRTKRNEVTFIVVTQTNTRRSADFPQGGRVTLPDKIVVPLIGGWSAVQQAYENAVAAIRKELEAPDAATQAA